MEKFGDWTYNTDTQRREARFARLYPFSCSSLLTSHAILFCMEGTTSPQELQATLKSEQEDALHETVRMIVSGYLKNNLDKHANPTSKHFAAGLTKSLDSGMQIKNPSSREAKIASFLSYINKDDRSGTVDTHEFLRQDSATSPLHGIIHELAEDFAIDVSDKKKLDTLAEAVHQSEVTVLIKRGQGGDVEQQGMSSWDDLDDEIKEKYRSNVTQKQQEQVRSLERWIKYVASDEAEYPSWYKYFIIVSLRSMGVEQFELGTYTYGGRDKKKTLFRFPTLNPAVLAKVYDRMLAAYDNEDRQKPTPSKYDIQETLRSNIDDAEKLFLEKYAKEANFAQLYAYELSKYKERTIESKRSSEGIWVKYNQQDEGTQALKDEAHKLSQSLQDKGTMWCTEGTNFSESQLVGGDFYVYYTREDVDKESYSTSLDDMTDEERRAVCTMPRIAIKMSGGKIGELRGIVGGNEQDLEPEMLDIAQAKYRGDEEKGEAPLGGYEEYEKKTQDMKRLLVLIEMQDKGTQFTRDDLRFLYEIDGTIEGFGHNEDTRIDGLRSKRNRREDVKSLCNCEPQFIAHDFVDINEQTQVFFEDDGKKIAIVDFREERNKAKVTQLTEIAKKIKETGSPARPDISFLGGIVHASISKEFLKDRETAFRKFKEADSVPEYIWQEWGKVPFVTPEKTDLDFIVFSYNEDPNTRKSSEKIVEDMKKLGYRPPTLEEMILAGIAEPKFTKTPSKYFVGLTSYQVGGGAFVPVLCRRGDRRRLGGGGWGDEWDSDDRFLAVRK